MTTISRGAHHLAVGLFLMCARHACASSVVTCSSSSTATQCYYGMVGPTQAVASISSQYDNQIVAGLVLPSPPSQVGKPSNGTLGWLQFNASSDTPNVMFCTTYSVLCANLLLVPGITTANCPRTATLTWMGATRA